MTNAQFYYISGSRVVLNGSIAVSVPNGAKGFDLMAENGNVFFVVNGTSATGSSPGFVAQNSAHLFPMINNFKSLHLYGSGSAIAHIQYFTF